MQIKDEENTWGKQIMPSGSNNTNTTLKIRNCTINAANNLHPEISKFKDQLTNGDPDIIFISGQEMRYGEWFGRDHIANELLNDPNFKDNYELLFIDKQWAITKPFSPTSHGFFTNVPKTLSAIFVKKSSMKVNTISVKDSTTYRAPNEINKGGISTILDINGQKIGFAAAHISSSSTEKKEEQLTKITQFFGENQVESYQIVGDLNYRVDTKLLKLKLKINDEDLKNIKLADLQNNPNISETCSALKDNQFMTKNELTPLMPKEATYYESETRKDKNDNNVEYVKFKHGNVYYGALDGGLIHGDKITTTDTTPTVIQTDRQSGFDHNIVIFDTQATVPEAKPENHTSKGASTSRVFRNGIVANSVTIIHEPTESASSKSQKHNTPSSISLPSSSISADRTSEHNRLSNPSNSFSSFFLFQQHHQTETSASTSSSSSSRLFSYFFPQAEEERNASSSSIFSCSFEHPST